MADRLAIAFADRDARVCGIAIEGIGTVLAGPDGVHAIAAAQPRPRAADAFEVSGPDGLALEGGLMDVRGRAGGTAIEGEAAWLRLDVAGAPARAVAVFLGGVTFALTAARPAGARGHGEERVSARIQQGDPPVSLRIADARLSTTYDGGGLVRHAGLEIWESADSEYARRAAGEASTHAELAGPGAAARVTFLDGHGDGGRHGPGVYVIVSAVS